MGAKWRLVRRWVGKDFVSDGDGEFASSGGSGAKSDFTGFVGAKFMIDKPLAAGQPPRIQ